MESRLKLIRYELTFLRRVKNADSEYQLSKTKKVI